MASDEPIEEVIRWHQQFGDPRGPEYLSLDQINDGMELIDLIRRRGRCTRSHRRLARRARVRRRHRLPARRGVCDMTDFDPGAEPETQEDADNYVRWCAENFNRVVSSDDTLRTYRTGFRCAAWLLVVSVAQLHLHDDVDQHREIMMNNLAGHMKVARRAERQDETLSVRDLIEAVAERDYGLSYDDYAVVPNTAIIDKMNWQKVNLITRQLGGPPMSAN
jgi:hypothetical protein